MLKIRRLKFCTEPVFVGLLRSPAIDSQPVFSRPLQIVSRSRGDLDRVLKEIEEEGGQGLVAPTDTGDR